GRPGQEGEAGRTTVAALGRAKEIARFFRSLSLLPIPFPAGRREVGLQVILVRVATVHDPAAAVLLQVGGPFVLVRERRERIHEGPRNRGSGETLFVPSGRSSFQPFFAQVGREGAGGKKPCGVCGLPSVGAILPPLSAGPSPEFSSVGENNPTAPGR